ncbi:hypothetical protein VTJ04DRAFT_3834 [Mycothermus thermophilus]|uniref:uncharacterized protein n=1 Tax=Humicola insolens TaxID=85995 RepID=UPI0037421A61
MQDAATEGKEGSDGSYSSVVRRISVEHELQQLQRAWPTAESFPKQTPAGIGAKPDLDTGGGASVADAWPYAGVPTQTVDLAPTKEGDHEQGKTGKRRPNATVTVTTSPSASLHCQRISRISPRACFMLSQSVQQSGNSQKKTNHCLVPSPAPWTPWNPRPTRQLTAVDLGTVARGTNPGYPLWESESGRRRRPS